MGAGGQGKSRCQPRASPGILPKPPDRAERLTPGKGAQVLCRLSQHIGLPMEGRGLCRASPGGLKVWL